MGRRKKHIGKGYIVILLIVILLLLFGILSITNNNKLGLNKIESLFKDGITSINKIIGYPFNYIANKVNDYNKLNNVREENDLLESDINRVNTLETENTELRREIDALKSELGITYIISDYDFLNATVISRNILYWYNTITINKGSSSGIEEGMAVVNASGLIGRTTNVTSFTTDVKLITTNDTNNKISVSIASNNNKLYGVINGYDFNNNTLEVEGISNTETVTEGDLVYTSGLGGVFPSGILIGYVKNIKTDSYDLAKIIEVEISADFNDLNFVAVLKRKSDE